jgi:hypothetical protein
MTMNQLPGDYDDVDFQIEKEDWNTYELKDGVKIKGRIIVLGITKNKNAHGDYAIQSQNFFAISAPRHMRGPPSTPLPPNEIDPKKMIPVEAERSNEVWNTYRILPTGDAIKVKLLATDIYKVENGFDQNGQPQYLITTGVIITPISKSNFRT